MQFFADNSGPREALTGLLIDDGDKIPPALRARLRAMNASPSVVDLVVTGSEVLYANAADLPQSGKVVAAQFAAFRAANDWQRDADGTNTRALSMRDALMRDAGEKPLPGVKFGKKDDDPVVLDGMVVVPPEEPAA